MTFTARMAAWAADLGPHSASPGSFYCEVVEHLSGHDTLKMLGSARIHELAALAEGMLRDSITERPSLESRATSSWVSAPTDSVAWGEASAPGVMQSQ